MMAQAAPQMMSAAPMMRGMAMQRNQSSEEEEEDIDCGAMLEDMDEYEDEGDALGVQLCSVETAPVKSMMREEKEEMKELDAMMSCASNEKSMAKEAVIETLDKKVEAPSGKPDFTTVINGQTTDGFWAAES